MITEFHLSNKLIEDYRETSKMFLEKLKADITNDNIEFLAKQFAQCATDGMFNGPDYYYPELNSRLRLCEYK